MRNAAVTFRERGDLNWGEDHYEWKRLRWEAVLASTRAAFSGGLTYAARWDEPLDAFSFWDQLDFIGVDLFTPLPGPSEPGRLPRLADVSRSLWRALLNAETGAAELGKRLLVVEIGFPSTDESWSAPSRPRGSVDERAQALFLGALAAQRRTWTQRQSEIAGLYVWCWSAQLDGGAAWERGYTLQGKRGEGALERVFREP